MKFSKLLAVLTLCSALAMAVFTYLFIERNAPGFTALYAIAGLGLIYVVAYGVASLQLAGKLQEAEPDNCQRGASTMVRLMLFLLPAVFIYVFVDSTLTDYYQPLSLFDEVSAVLVVSWLLLIIVMLSLSLRASSTPTVVMTKVLVLALVGFLGWPLAATLPWVNAPKPGEAVSLHRDVFVGGEGGYDIYRIPALLLLPAAAELAGGQTLKQDRLLAFAEARRDGALDTGAIDLIMKISDDGGATWSEQTIICRNDNQGVHEKCGNATPVFNAETGVVFLAYNRSGAKAAEGGGRHHSSHILSSVDGGSSWGQPQHVGDNNLVFGPGHGIQKQLAPYQGRLLIPGYADSNALVLYSDDHGKSWQRSQVLNTGNETEVAELSDGRVYMTTRHRAPIGRPPQPNGRLFSISSDGGASWPDAELDTSLITPVCQASVERYGDDGGLLFANPSHHKARVQLTIQYSPNDGTSWTQQIPVYAGPAGYSVLARASNNDVFILYERGNMAYSELISLAKVSAESIQR